MEHLMTDKKIKEGLGDMAHMAEKDHEVQMARADLYKIAKYSIKLHEMLKSVSEAEGLEGWVQSKITKAADYLGSVYHHLDYEQATGEIGEGKSPHKKGTKKYKKHMAAMHAESANDPYKSSLHYKLAEKKSKGIQAMIDAGSKKADAEAKESTSSRWKAQDAAANIYSKEKRKPDNREIDKIRAKYRDKKKEVAKERSLSKGEEKKKKST